MADQVILIGKAIAAIDKMAAIVETERIIRGEYVADVTDSGRTLCQTHHCAIGALWVGAGVRVRKSAHGKPFLPGTFDVDGERNTYIAKHKPELRPALDALNKAAERYAKRNDINLKADDGYCNDFTDTIEALFERHDDYGDPILSRTDLLKVIKAARRDLVRQLDKLVMTTETQVKVDA